MIADRFAAWPTRAPSLTVRGRLLRYVAAWPLAGWALSGGLVALAGLRFALLSDAEAPPGSDGGNWLAFARELFGEDVKAADAVYPPVVPFLLRPLMELLGPLTAMKTLAVASSVLMGFPLYLILRRELHPVLSVTLTLAFVMAGYQQETLAFGGYPQLLATAFLLLSLYWLGLGLLEGKSRLILLSAVAGALVVGTHMLAATLLMVSAPLLAGYFAFQQRGLWMKVAARFAKWAAATTALALTLTPFYLPLLSLLDGNPANPHGYSIINLDNTVAYVFREQLVLWVALTVVGLPVLVLMAWRRSDSLLAPTAAALLFGPTIVFAVTGEVRSLQLLEAGVFVSWGLLAAYVIDSFASGRAEHWWPGWPALAVGAVCVAMAVAISVSGQNRALDSFRFYSVLDNEAVKALDWLRLQEEGTVVATVSPKGLMYGWWIEGYARRPAYNATDPRWFNFREEKLHVAAASRMLSPRLGPQGVSRLVGEHDIRYVFLDRWSEIDTSGLRAAGFRPAYQSTRYLVLAWRPAPASRAERAEPTMERP